MSKTLEEKIAVMQEAAKGAKIERRSRHHSKSLWFKDSDPEWDWVNYNYQVATTPEPDWERIHWELFRHCTPIRHKDVPSNQNIEKVHSSDCDYFWLKQWEFYASCEWKPCSEYPL